MQLASRCLRLGASKSGESRAAQGTRSAVTRRVGVNGRANAKNYKTSAAVMSDKPVAPHYDSTPVTAESFKHLEMPADLMKEAIAFRKEVQELDDSHQRLAMVDTIQTLAAQVGLLQKAAAHLKKDIRDVTALDAATYRLHEHEQFVSSVQLDKVVLFSHKQTLDNFRAGVKTIAARYAGGQLPADLKKQLETAEATLAALAANEEIVEVPVSEELYQHAQNNLFPSLSKKGVTPQDLLDFVGGDEGLIDPVTFHVRDLLVQLEKAPDADKSALLTKLEQSIVAFEQGLPEIPGTEAEQYAWATAQLRAEKNIGKLLGRRAVMGDIAPERRLERGLEICHPMLANEQTYYVHGDVTNLKSASMQMLKDEAPTFEFTKRADFNPPTGYRPLDAAHLAVEPETAEFARREALNFPLWEGEQAARAINSYELIAEMKLYKLFHYQYPMIGDSEEAQKLFMELYDVSPGEPTLEWTLSYPTKEHTFFPEHPLWVQVFEDDEEVAPIVWPEYTPVVVEGLAEVSSALGAESASIRFLPHSKEAIAQEAHYNLAFSAIPVEKRFNTPRQQVVAAAQALSAADKQKAEAAWAALTPSQKQFARRAWDFEANPIYTAESYVKTQDAIQNLQQKVLASAQKL